MRRAVVLWVSLSLSGCAGMFAPPNTAEADAKAAKVKVASASEVSSCSFVTIIPGESSGAEGQWMKFGPELTQYLTDSAIRGVRIDAGKRGATHVVLGDIETKESKERQMSVVSDVQTVKVSGKAYKCAPGGK